MTFTAPEVRVYFNKDTNPDKAWSVDFGPGTQEILCAYVKLVGVEANSNLNLAESNSAYPKAWIYLGRTEVQLYGNTIILRTIGKI